MTMTLYWWDDVLVYQPENDASKSSDSIAANSRNLKHQGHEAAPRKLLWRNVLVSVSALRGRRVLLPWRFFQQPLFEFLLALDAVARPGHGLEALRVDFLPAVDAFAEVPFPDACQRSTTICRNWRSLLLWLKRNSLVYELAARSAISWAVILRWQNGRLPGYAIRCGADPVAVSPAAS